MMLMGGIAIARAVAPCVRPDAGRLETLARGRHPGLPGSLVGKRLERRGDHWTRSAARWTRTSPSSRLTLTNLSSGSSQGRISVS